MLFEIQSNLLTDGICQYFANTCARLLIEEVIAAGLFVQCAAILAA